MENIKKLFNKYILLFLILTLLPSVLALTVKGFYGASDDLHVSWLYEMDKIVKMGQFPPRFVPDLSFGFGYPLFNFVFPLPFYLGELVHLLGFSFVDSVKIIFGISLLLGGLSMYLLLRNFVSPILAMAGAVLYTYTPYRATDVYDRGAIGESLGFIFYPLILLAFFKISKDKMKWISIGALSLAGLVLSHNISTYMFIPFVFILGLILSKSWYKIKNILLFIILGLLMTSYFWVPALMESTLMQYDTVFNFIDHFPTLRQLFTPYWGYGASVPGPYDGISFYLGSFNLLVLVLGVISFIVFRKKLSKEEKIFLTWAFISFVLVMFMMNFRSSFLWSHLPLLPYFQFPWRFLIITTVLFPLFLIPLKNIKHIDTFALIFIASVIYFNTPIFQPNDFLGREDSYYINRYIPVPVASSEYKNLKEEYLRLSKNTSIRPDKNYPLVSPEEKVTKITEKNELDTYIETSSENEFILYYRKYYYPGWMATIDGNIVELVAGKPSGEINISIPSGKHTVHVYYSETNFRLLFDILSVIGVLLTIGWLIYQRKNK